MDIDKLSFIEKWMIKNVKSPTGDYRDWEAIAAWASAVAAELQGAAPAPATGSD